MELRKRSIKMLGLESVTGQRHRNVNNVLTKIRTSPIVRMQRARLRTICQYSQHLPHFGMKSSGLLLKLQLEEIVRSLRRPKRKRRKKNPQRLPIKERVDGKSWTLFRLWFSTPHCLALMEDEAVVEVDEEVEILAAGVHHLERLLKKDRMVLLRMEMPVDETDMKVLHEALLQRGSDP
jgi:hypothetical protein